MKLKSLLTLFILVAVVIVGLFTAGFMNKNSHDFTVLSTNYLDKKTDIQTYHNNSLVGYTSFPIGGVETIEYDDVDQFIFDKYGDELLEIENNITKNHKIKMEPLFLEKYKDNIYALHNEGINSFSLAIYDHEFNSIDNSEEIPGFARKFVITGELIHVLANVYEQDGNRTVGIYTFDFENLRLKNFTELEELTYGFYIENNNGELVIYGNSDEKKKDLVVYSINLNSGEKTLRVKSENKVMWVSKVLNLDNQKIMLNNFSIISMGIDFKNITVVYANDKTLIDFEYDEVNKIFYLLSGNPEEDTFEVVILDRNFSELKKYPLEFEDTIPKDILLNYEINSKGEKWNEKK